MTDKAAWQGETGTAWAKHYSRTDRSFLGLTDRLLGRASAREIARVLDIGCGAGELSMALGRGHPHAKIVGVDVSDELIEVAKRRGRNLMNVDFEVADVSEWDRSGFTPDLLVSRHGVMFFDEPVAAFSHLAEIASTDARLVFSCFRSVRENPWAGEVASFLPAEASEEPVPGTPGPFAFADPDHVEPILSEAGWRDIHFEPVDFAYVTGAGENPVEDAMAHFKVIGPAARPLALLDGEQRRRFEAKLQYYLSRNLHSGIVALPAAAWIVTAVRGQAD
ncbi:MAG: class I SAM-dependent methyltransferase [Erythrobacter sp.]|nr:class I SAM-dependent methyltransferase [Erythrobacter sp.]